MRDFGRNVKESMKQMVIPRSMIFEQLGILCTAPIDGHDIGLLKETLAVALDRRRALCWCTWSRKKGAGYAPAEQDPETFHGIASFRHRRPGRRQRSRAQLQLHVACSGKALVRGSAKPTSASWP